MNTKKKNVLKFHFQVVELQRQLAESQRRADITSQEHRSLTDLLKETQHNLKITNEKVNNLTVSAEHSSHIFLTFCLHALSCVGRCTSISSQIYEKHTTNCYNKSPKRLQTSQQPKQTSPNSNTRTICYLRTLSMHFKSDRISKEKPI